MKLRTRIASMKIKIKIIKRTAQYRRRIQFRMELGTQAHPKINMRRRIYPARRIFDPAPRFSRS
jgi:hypothetical protein